MMGVNLLGPSMHRRLRVAISPLVIWIVEGQLESMSITIRSYLHVARGPRASEKASDQEVPVPRGRPTTATNRWRQWATRTLGCPRCDGAAQLVVGFPVLRKTSCPARQTPHERGGGGGAGEWAAASDVLLCRAGGHGLLRRVDLLVHDLQPRAKGRSTEVPMESA